MADYYRKLLSDETDSLSSRVKKFNTILDSEGEKLSESVIGQIRLVIGQSNLFINERFKQFSGLIDDCQLKRGEKETKVEDLAGFWDMIYYQVDDLKTKYAELESLEANNWESASASTDKVKPVKILVNDNKPLVKARKPLANTNGVVKKSTNKSLPTNDTVDAKKPPPRSNIREFLKNKRKELANGGAIDTNGKINEDDKKSKEKSEAITNGRDECKSSSSTESCSSEDEKENKNHV